MNKHYHFTEYEDIDSFNKINKCSTDFQRGPQDIVFRRIIELEKTLHTKIDKLETRLKHLEEKNE